MSEQMNGLSDLLLYSDLSCLWTNPMLSATYISSRYPFATCCLGTEAWIQHNWIPSTVPPSIYPPPLWSTSPTQHPSQQPSSPLSNPPSTCWLSLASGTHPSLCSCRGVGFALSFFLKAFTQSKFSLGKTNIRLKYGKCPFWWLLQNIQGEYRDRKQSEAYLQDRCYPD